MKEQYQVPWYNTFGRAILLPLLRFAFSTLGRLEVTGKENIPTGTPYLVVFNHVSLYDAPVVVSNWPEKPEVLGASDVWNRPGQNVLARIYGGIPIHRGEVDRIAMYKMVSALESGRPLLVAPEGGRSHQPGMRRGKPGAIFVLEKVDVPIIPVGVVGTTDDYLSNLLHFRRPMATVKIGKPFRIPAEIGGEGTRTEKYQMRVDYIMQRIADLLPEAYKGVYASKP